MLHGCCPPLSPCAPTTPSRCTDRGGRGMSEMEQLGDDIAGWRRGSRPPPTTCSSCCGASTACGRNPGFLPAPTGSLAHGDRPRRGAREGARGPRLPALPRLSAALQRGGDLLRQGAGPDPGGHPGERGRLLDVALTATASQVERVVRAWRRCDRVAGPAGRRAASGTVDCASMWTTTGCWWCRPPGARPSRALSCSRRSRRRLTSLWREARRGPGAGHGVSRRAPAQRRADALARLAETALAGGLEGGTAGDRYQVVLHVDAAHDAAPADRRRRQHSRWPRRPQGRRAPRWRPGANAATARWTFLRKRRPGWTATLPSLSSGRTPTGTTWMWAARPAPCHLRSAARSRRGTPAPLPGCTARRCDAHHVVHWAEGGPTRLDNLSCCAGAIIGCCTRAATPCVSTPARCRRS